MCERIVRYSKIPGLSHIYKSLDQFCPALIFLNLIYAVVAYDV